MRRDSPACGARPGGGCVTDRVGMVCAVDRRCVHAVVLAVGAGPGRQGLAARGRRSLRAVRRFSAHAPNWRRSRAANATGRRGTAGRSFAPSTRWRRATRRCDERAAKIKVDRRSSAPTRCPSAATSGAATSSRRRSRARRSRSSSGFAAALVATMLGTVLGAVAGYFGGWVDDLLEWVYNVFTLDPRTSC